MTSLCRIALRGSLLNSRSFTPRPTALRYFYRPQIRLSAAQASSEPVVTATNRKDFLELVCLSFSDSLTFPHVSFSHSGAEATLKRFWKVVGIEERSLSGEAKNAAGEKGYVVTLDKRPLKTPSGNVLALPKEKRLVATLIAMEWENQETMLKQHSLPMVRNLCSLHILLLLMLGRNRRLRSPPGLLMLSRMKTHVVKSVLNF